MIFKNAKVPNLDGYSTSKHDATVLSTEGIQYHTSVLFNEVCSFVLAQGAQELSAKVEI